MMIGLYVAAYFTMSGEMKSVPAIKIKRYNFWKIRTGRNKICGNRGWDGIHYNYSKSESFQIKPVVNPWKL